MARFGLLSLALAFVAVIGITSLSNSASAADACKRTQFETKLIKDACASGGQKAAKEAMKKFVKEAKKKKADADCNLCHKSLAPKYELKPEGLKTFKELGGV